ncbi:carboxymuconolactone decarboxylase family protein [Nonomuraea sp. NPDC049400]|uniref:carboxymuconolactone decarboxylase family protein n=1 Tax=Nonomuraea sp. NPDC049400 TaxID=3364352 RepID=UPI0037A29F2B
MVQLAAMIACQAVSEYRVMLGAALTAGITPVESKEIVYQAVPYVGMAKVFDFLHATNDVLTERGVEGPPRSARPAPARRTADPNPRDRAVLRHQFERPVHRLGSRWSGLLAGERAGEACQDGRCKDPPHSDHRGGEPLL